MHFTTGISSPTSRGQTLHFQYQAGLVMSSAAAIFRFYSQLLRKPVLGSIPRTGAPETGSCLQFRHIELVRRTRHVIGAVVWHSTVFYWIWLCVNFRRGKFYKLAWEHGAQLMSRRLFGGVGDSETQWGLTQVCPGREAYADFRVLKCAERKRFLTGIEFWNNQEKSNYFFCVRRHWILALFSSQSNS